MGLLSRLLGGGTPAAEIDVAGVAAAQQDPAVQIVDCRTEREWNSGHLQGSRLIPLGSIGDNLRELDKERPVIVVCRSGHRSGIASRQLSSAGFTDVRSMKGGIAAWSRAGQTLVT